MGERPTYFSGFCSICLTWITDLLFLKKLKQVILFVFIAEFSMRNPVLFARFIPNILPPTQCDQLPSLIQEDCLLQENLVTSQGFTR